LWERSILDTNIARSIENSCSHSTRKSHLDIPFWEFSRQF
jgi:hypothetical protein